VEDVLDPKLSENALREACNCMADTREAGLRISDFSIVLHERYHDTAQVSEFLRKVLHDEIDEINMVFELTLAFPELNIQNGVYAQVNQLAERGKTLASIMSVIWLLKNSYRNFIAPQDPAACLGVDNWKSFQSFVKWAGLNMEMIHALIVYLVIRGLGKATLITSQLPPEEQGPEAAVLFLITNAHNVVPSVSLLSSDMLHLVKTNLSIQARFNLGQMIQGENTPASVAELKDFADTHGNRFLKFYLFSLVGTFCGVAGGGVGQNGALQGSVFMNEKNGSQTLLCVSSLGYLRSKKPQEIYWCYILARVTSLLDLPANTSEEIAFARLVCLCRIQHSDGVGPIKEAWEALSRSGQLALTEHLLKDGILERTFLFFQLPLCLANAKNNEDVGLPAALVVLAELIDMLNAGASQLGNSKSPKCMMVDLSDLAVFLGTVKNTSVLFTCIMEAELQEVGDSVRLKMSAKTWSQANDDDADTEINVEKGIKRIIRKQEVLEDAIGRMAAHLPTRPPTDAKVELASPCSKVTFDNLSAGQRLSQSHAMPATYSAAGSSGRNFKPPPERPSERASPR